MFSAIFTGEKTHNVTRWRSEELPICLAASQQHGDEEGRSVRIVHSGRPWLGWTVLWGKHSAPEQSPSRLQAKEGKADSMKII